MSNPILVEPNRNKSRWFAGIDSLRFVFALVVLLGHLKNPIALTLTQSGNKLVKFTGGFLNVSFVGVVAVMAFFIISGFVIHYPNKDGISDFKSYFIRRFTRVLIPMMIVLAIGHFYGDPVQAVIWSLVCELIYYTIYPALLYIKISWRWKIAFAYITCFLIIFFLAHNEVLSLVAQKNIKYNGNYMQLGYSITWLIGLPTWLLGVCLANQIEQSGNRVSLKTVFIWRFFIFLLSVTCSILRFHHYVSYIILLPVISIPIYLWLRKEIIYYRTHQPVKWFEDGGKFSYSIYLCHPLIFVILNEIIPLNNWFYFLYLILTIILSYVFYKLVEYPSHLLAKSLSKQKRYIRLITK